MKPLLKAILDYFEAGLQEFNETQKWTIQFQTAFSINRLMKTAFLH
ncbi:MAG: hypothetical protein RIR97_1683 [Pseudomonadota bacterium]